MCFWSAIFSIFGVLPEDCRPDLRASSKIADQIFAQTSKIAKIADQRDTGPSRPLTTSRARPRFMEPQRYSAPPAAVFAHNRLTSG